MSKALRDYLMRTMIQFKFLKRLEPEGDNSFVITTYSDGRYRINVEKIREAEHDGR